MSALVTFEKAPETNRGRVLYRMLLAVHAGIRSELVRVERLAAAVVDGLPADGFESVAPLPGGRVLSTQW